MITETTRLVVALAAVETRFAAAQRIARRAGADALYVLARDAVVDAYVPAMGFPPTLPGGAGWRELLALAEHPGVHAGRVAYPVAGTIAPALACAESGCVAVFVGGAPDREVVAQLVSLLPLVAATLHAELDANVARGELSVVQEQARAAEALARALDGARSELEARSRALDEARERAVRAVRAQDEFLAMLGHELRNPLSPITTALHLLRLKARVGHEHEIIERQVAHLTRLVDDLLDVSRLTAGKIALNRRPLELAEIATRAIEMASPLLERKRQALAVDIAPRGLVVDADPGRLAQILANLLTNASKYSDEHARIAIVAERGEAHVRIRVRDPGIGIAPDMLDRIFDRFEQQRQAIDRSQGGLGLGLAIVRSLVHLHGGTVRAASEGEGKGSEFIVELPRAAGEGEPAAPPDVAPRAHIALPGRRILVVDDNEDALTLLAEALRAAGYEVMTAHDGPAALRSARMFVPDIAILDIGLPVMDGYELAERLRSMLTGRPLRLVAVTGYGQAADRRRARLAGFDAHLVKPVQLDDLLAAFGADDLETAQAGPGATNPLDGR